jgi:hypothetical protein
MNHDHRPQTRHPADGHRGLRLLGLAAVVAGLLLMVAAAFVLSYAGIHAVALSAGVSPRVARIYPLIFDAMLVVACAAVLSLRGAGVPSRLYAWLTTLALFAAAAGADTLQATGTRLPHKPAAAAAAIIPWALVLIGFGLLLCMLRQARLRRAAVDGLPETVLPERSAQVTVRAGIHELMGAASPAGAAGNGTGRGNPGGEPAADLAIDTDPGQDDPASDEALAWFPRARDEQPAGKGRPPGGPEAGDHPASGFGPERSASAFSPAPTMPPDAEAADAGPVAQSGPELEEDEDAFLGLVALARPEAASGVPPATQIPPQPRPAPGAGAEAQPDPQPASVAAAGTQPGPAPDPQPDPQPGPPSPDGQPLTPVPPQPRPAPEAGAEAPPEPSASPETNTAAELEPGLKAEPESQPVPDAASLATATSSRPQAGDAEPQAAGSDPGPEAGAEPAPPAAQFDRMRSSPVPPEE